MPPLLFPNSGRKGLRVPNRTGRKILKLKRKKNHHYFANFKYIICLLDSSDCHGLKSPVPDGRENFETTIA